MPEPDLQTAFMLREPALKELARILQTGAEEALAEVPHIDRISFRTKSVKSFLAKAVPTRYPSPIEQIEDLVGGRVITFYRDDIAVVREALVEWFGAVEHETKEPKRDDEFGYESDHFVFVIPEHLKPESWTAHEPMPTTFELQVRTLFMHAWAEPQHDLGYKGADLDASTKRELAWVAASAWGADRMMNDIANRWTNGTP